MTKKQYEAYKKEMDAKHGIVKKPRKRRKKATEINLLAPLVKKVLRTTNIVGSLINFIDNGKKEFGGKFEYIVRTHNFTAVRFSVLRLRIRELNAKTAEVNHFASKNESETYQYIEKLSYILDDVRDEFAKCIKAIEDSGVLIDFKNETCIKCTGKRLGLAEIVRRSGRAIPAMIRMFDELQNISLQNGDDIFAYDPYTLRRTNK